MLEFGPACIHQIQAFVAQYDFDSAIWLCERFLSEIPASEGNQDVRYLLATCYYRSGKPNSAYLILEGATAPASRYLFALCCYEMQKFHEGEKALLGSASPSVLAAASSDNVPCGSAGFNLLGRISQRSGRTDQAVEYYKNSLELDSFCWSSYKALSDLGVKLDHSQSCFQAADLMKHYHSQASAARTGPAAGQDAVTPLPSSSVFDSSSSLSSRAIDPTSALFTATPLAAVTGPHFETPEGTAGGASGGAGVVATEGGGVGNAAPTPATSTPVARSTRRSTRMATASTAKHTAPTGKEGGVSVRRSKRLEKEYQEKGAEKKAKGGSSLSSSSPIPSFQSLIAEGAGGRGGGGRAGAGEAADFCMSGVTPRTHERSRSLTSARKTGVQDSAPSAQVAQKKLSFLTPGDEDSSSHNYSSSNSHANSSSHTEAKTRASSRAAGRDRGQQEREGAPAWGGNHGSSSANVGEGVDVDAVQQQCNEYCGVLQQLGLAYQQSRRFRCAEAVQVMLQLPKAHFSAGWTQVCLGRCYFEQVDYHRACAAFQMARKARRHSLDGMEYYSTALWHLKKEMELSFLAQEAVQFDRLAAETWVVVGNSFSLQKEHETALKFFSRAIQLSPASPYAYTLCAHEYVANEDFDKAIAGYRKAIGVDERHYNAWYGLGNIYYRQEKYELAAYHFRRALKINDRSSVLYCYLGMVLHANRWHTQALEMLEKADSLQPSNPLAKFQKANVHISLNQLHLALAELEKVKEFAPKEASVHFLIGKIWKKLNQPDKAMMGFITALDLDPKDRNLVKAAIDKLHISNANDSQSDEEF